MLCRAAKDRHTARLAGASAGPVTPLQVSGEDRAPALVQPDEYKQLYTATRAHAKNPPQAQYQWNADQVHDYVLFMGNTGMRPDEAKNLQHRDVTVMTDPGSGQEILEIEVCHASSCHTLRSFRGARGGRSHSCCSRTRALVAARLRLGPKPLY